MRLGFAAFFLTLAAPAFASDLVGPESCRTCHAEAYRIWAQGPHARAVASFSAEAERMAPPRAVPPERASRLTPIAVTGCA